MYPSDEAINVNSKLIKISQRVHIHCRYTILAHLFHSLYLSFSVSLLLSPTNSPIYLYLSSPPHLSLSPSFPPFLYFHLRLFNLFYDHSPSLLSPPFHPLIITDVITHYAFCVQNTLWGIEPRLFSKPFRGNLLQVQPLISETLSECVENV